MGSTLNLGRLADPNVDLDEPAVQSDVEALVDAMQVRVAELKASGVLDLDPAELDALSERVEFLLERVREHRANQEADRG